MAAGVEEPPVGGQSWYRRRAVLVAAAIVPILALAAFLIARSFGGADLVAIVAELREYGRHWWAPAALIGAVIVINVIGLPGTPLTLACGAVWGWAAGSAWMMTATMIGTAVPYLIARHGLAGAKESLGGRPAAVLRWIESSGFTAVAVLRLAHLFPFAIISYGAGVVGVRAGAYFAGTFVGTLPGVLIWTYVADLIIAGMMSPAQAKQRIVVAAALIITLVVGTNLVARKMRRKTAGPSAMQ